MPRPSRSTRSCPRDRYSRLTSVISSSPRGDGFRAAGDVDDLVVVEVQAGHGIRRLRLCGLLFQPDRASGGVELDDAVAFGVAHLVPEYRRAVGVAGGIAQRVRKAGAVEDVVAERQRDLAGADELTADDERLRQPIRAGLRRVGDRHPEIAAVAQQAAEALLILRRRDDEDVANTRQHQRRQRVIHHRFVVDRQELLADAARQRMQTRAGPSREHDSLEHRLVIVSRRGNGRPAAGQVQA